MGLTQITTGGVDDNINIDSNTLKVDGSNNRVGIGTSSPGFKLEVNSGTSDSVALFKSSDTTARIILRDNGSTSGGYVGVATEDMFFHTNGTERLRIDSSGNVGIGTTSPGSYLASAHQLVISDSASTGLTIATPTSSSGTIAFADGTGAADNARGLIRYGHSDNSLQFSTNASERLRIDSSGNVAIGTSTIGSGSLTLYGSGSRTMYQGSSTGTGDGNGFTTGNNGSTDAFLWNYENGFMQFATNNTERLRIDSSGRLLVGHSSSRSSANALEPRFQMEGINVSTSTAAIVRNENGTNGPILALSKSRGTSTGSSTIVQNGDITGAIHFAGADGTDLNSFTAWIQSEVDGTPGSNDMPGRLTFYTTADGANSPTERMRITSTGKVGIGVADPIQKLQLHENSSGASVISFTNNTTGDGISDGLLVGLDSTEDGLVFMKESQSIIFGTGNSERMRITSNGSLLLNMTTTNSQIEGCYFNNVTPQAFHQVLVNNTSSSTSANLYINRQASDGRLIEFRQADNTEGHISVSGTTISYNGGHLTRWSQPASNADFTGVLRGSVLSNTDEMCEWAHAAQDEVLYTAEDELPEGVSVGDVKTPAKAAYTEDNEQLNRMKISDVEGDRDVAGVFQEWDADEEFPEDFYCAMTGDFVIRIAQGTTVARGDLLMSAGDGTAKPQDDDIVRSKTIAKVTSTTVSTTYSDGSYCVPCVLMTC